MPKFICANCHIPIHWQPTVVDGQVYCCVGCATDGLCECDYDHLPMPDDRVALVVRHSQVALVAEKWIYQSVQIAVSKEAR